MANNKFDKPHLFLKSNVISQKFTAPSRTPDKVIGPSWDRVSHSKKLRGDLKSVSRKQLEVCNDVSHLELKMGIGIQVEFEGFPNFELAFESLSDSRHGIELHNVKKIKKDNAEVSLATVFIPNGKLDVFEKKITDYLNKKTTSGGKPRDNKKLIDSIKDIRVAAFSAIWSDNNSYLPINKQEKVWWEVWLSTPKKLKDKTNNHCEILDDFKTISKDLKIELSDHILKFPENIVVNVFCAQDVLESSSLLLGRIAEIRSPKVAADYFDSATHNEQRAWAEDLLTRLQVEQSSTTPYVCIIDSGVNIEHPLLEPFIQKQDQFTISSDQTTVDNLGHGTAMAGLAAWGDLCDVIASKSVTQVSHKVESVKVISFNGDNKDKPQGCVTSDAISTVEIKHPQRKRTFSMSLSSNCSTDRGRPSSWSSALDSLAVDSLGDNFNPRLFTVCAGNTSFNCFQPNLFIYPDFNQTQDIHDPAQAWNVISVGAYTNKVTNLQSSEYVPLAKAGSLSPHSTTSLIWDRKNSPLKPEVVFEGGNIGKGEFDYRDDIFDYDLLTLHHDFSRRIFQTSNATSAATALAARFTAQISAEYPNIWPETVRALTIHSAEWNDSMYDLLGLNKSKKVSKKDMVNLTRMVGFGVPNLNKALKSAGNSLSLVIENTIQPFEKGTNSIRTKSMHLYDLPWPKDELMALGSMDVELTVTLSYFIEPNPSSRNILNKYSYASHQLRFDVKRPLESDVDFQKRINQANRESKTDKPDSSDDSKWSLGTGNRHRGSIHKDIWRGSAAELAERGKVAIYPATGWWKTRSNLGRWNSEARYSLIVSLSVPEADIDIYSKIKAKIDTVIEATSSSIVEI